MIQAALADASTPPEAMQCIELHGTGTPLGDPIEVGALVAALAGTRAAAAPVMLGAAKSHLGHAGPAAGSSALVRSATRCAAYASASSGATHAPGKTIEGNQSLQ